MEAVPMASVPEIQPTPSASITIPIRTANGTVVVLHCEWPPRLTEVEVTKLSYGLTLLTAEVEGGVPC